MGVRVPSGAQRPPSVRSTGGGSAFLPSTPSGVLFSCPSVRGDTQGRCVLSWPRWCVAGEPSRGGVDADGGLKEKPPPLHETWGVMKLSSPQHAQNLLFLPIFDEQGRFFFHAACESTFSCSAGAVFLSLRSLVAPCCEIGSTSVRTLRHLGETGGTFARGCGRLNETDIASASEKRARKD